MVYIVFGTINKLYFFGVAMAPKTYTPIYENTKKSYAQIRKEKIEAYMKKMSAEERQKRDKRIKKSQAIENILHKTRLTAEENAKVEKEWVKTNGKPPSSKNDFEKLRKAKEAKREEKRKEVEEKSAKAFDDDDDSKSGADILKEKREKMLKNFKKAMQLEEQRRRDLSNMTAAKKKVGYKSEDDPNSDFDEDSSGIEDSVSEDSSETDYSTPDEDDEEEEEISDEEIENFVDNYISSLPYNEALEITKRQLKVKLQGRFGHRKKEAYTKFITKATEDVQSFQKEFEKLLKEYKDMTRPYLRIYGGEVDRIYRTTEIEQELQDLLFGTALKTEGVRNVFQRIQSALKQLPNTLKEITYAVKQEIGDKELKELETLKTRLEQTLEEVREKLKAAPNKKRVEEIRDYESKPNYLKSGTNKQKNTLLDDFFRKVDDAASKREEELEKALESIDENTKKYNKIFKDFFGNTEIYSKYIEETKIDDIRNIIDRIDILLNKQYDQNYDPEEIAKKLKQNVEVFEQRLRREIVSVKSKIKELDKKYNEAREGLTDEDIEIIDYSREHEEFVKSFTQEDAVVKRYMQMRKLLPVLKTKITEQLVKRETREKKKEQMMEEAKQKKTLIRKIEDLDKRIGIPGGKMVGSRNYSSMDIRSLQEILESRKKRLEKKKKEDEIAAKQILAEKKQLEAKAAEDKRKREAAANRKKAEDNRKAAEEAKRLKEKAAVKAAKLEERESQEARNRATRTKLLNASDEFVTNLQEEILKKIRGLLETIQYIKGQQEMLESYGGYFDKVKTPKIQREIEKVSNYLEYLEKKAEIAKKNPKDFPIDLQLQNMLKEIETYLNDKTHRFSRENSVYSEELKELDKLEKEDGKEKKDGYTSDDINEAIQDNIQADIDNQPPSEDEALIDNADQQPPSEDGDKAKQEDVPPSFSDKVNYVWHTYKDIIVRAKADEEYVNDLLNVVYTYDKGIGKINTWSKVLKKLVPQEEKTFKDKLFNILYGTVTGGIVGFYGTRYPGMYDFDKQYNSKGSAKNLTAHFKDLLPKTEELTIQYAEKKFQLNRDEATELMYFAVLEEGYVNIKNKILKRVTEDYKEKSNAYYSVRCILGYLHGEPCEPYKTSAVAATKLTEATQKKVEQKTVDENKPDEKIEDKKGGLTVEEAKKKFEELKDKKKEYIEWFSKQQVVKDFIDSEDDIVGVDENAKNTKLSSWNAVLKALIEGRTKDARRARKSDKDRAIWKKAEESKFMDNEFASYFEKPINPSNDLASTMMHLQEEAMSCSRTYEPSSGNVPKDDLRPRPITKYDRRDAYNRRTYSDSSSDDDEDGFSSSDDEMEMSEGRISDMYKKYKKKIIEEGKKIVDEISKGSKEMDEECFVPTCASVGIAERKLNELQANNFSKSSIKL